MFSQQYMPFPTENAEWNVRFTATPEDFQEVHSNSLLKYTLRGDTIINNVSYKKVCMIVGTAGNPVYVGVGGLRESNKQIFYVGQGYLVDANITNDQQRIKNIKDCGVSTVNSNSGNETLLYDFNAHEGDRVQWGYESGTIEKIDSILIGHSYRKAYHFKYSNETVIEGIGNINSGLFGWVTPIPMCGGSWSWEFICFSQNGEALYLNPAYLDCNSMEKLGTVKYFGNDNQWYYKEDYVRPGTEDHFMISSYESLKGDRDTLINGKKYMKYSEGVGIRENNHKVYALYFNENYGQPDEFLLYDFSVKAGDTIHSTAMHGTLSRQPKVIRTETITLRNGELRKKIYLNEDTWIEGTGSLYGFFKPYIETPTCDCGGFELISFTRNDSLLYHDTDLCSQTWFCTNPIEAIPRVVNTNKKNVTVSPNPAYDFVKLTFANSNQQCVSVEIMDFQGRKINVIPSSGTNDIDIDLSTYHAGIYFLMVRYVGRIESHKLIKL